MDTVFTEKLNILLRQVSLISLLKDNYKVILRGGSKYTVQCPFHKDGRETNPSMSVDDEKGLYQCFTCGAKGNILTYLKEREGMSFKDAIEFLGKRFSVDVSGFFSEKNSKATHAYLESKRINNLAINFFGKNLLMKNEKGEYLHKEAVDYLKQRKIPFDIVKIFKIGYAPNNWKSLTLAMFEHKVDVKNLLALGLSRVSRQNTYYDNFINRIIFPIINEREEAIGFGGRTINGSEPKYLNSKESFIFKKRSVLYGINIAKNNIMKKDSVIVVEGYMDVVACHKVGINNCVGILGTAVSDEHIREIKKYTNNIIFALDSDEAGKKATMSAIYTSLKFDTKPYIINIEGAKDLDEYFTMHGKEGFNILDRAKLNWYDFIIMKELNLKSFVNLSLESVGIEEKKKLVEIFYRYFNVLKSESEKDMLIGYISEKLSINRDSLKRDYLRVSTRDTRRESSIFDSKSDRKNKQNHKNYENSLIYLLCIHPELIPLAEKEIDSDLIKNPIAKEFYIRLLTLKEYTKEKALNALENESVKKQIKMKEHLYIDNEGDKLLELIIKIKTYDIDRRRVSLLNNNSQHLSANSDEGFEAICEKAREIHVLNKQKEKIQEGKNI